MNSTTPFHPPGANGTSATELAHTNLPARPETILLVDDEELIRQLCGQILRRCGFQVLLAANGPEGIQLFRDRRDEIDLVVLDLTMPRMSGLEVLKKLVALDPTVRVLLSSGTTPDPEVRKEFPQVHGFLSKPYRGNDMAALLRAALDGAPSEPEA